jgi:formate/nitrite transporter FocA (FNT family)
VSRLWLLLLAIVAGAALALGATFTITSAVASVNESPSNQQLMNYGTR